MIYLRKLGFPCTPVNGVNHRNAILKGIFTQYAIPVEIAILL